VKPVSGVWNEAEVKDLLAVLDCGDAAGGEALAVAGAVDLVQDRNGRIAGADEVGMEGVAYAGLDRAVGGDERLRDDLSAEDASHPIVGRLAAEEVDLDTLQIEQRDQVGDGIFGEGRGVSHGSYPKGRERQPVMRQPTSRKRQWRRG
jgi:hypothetical protein